MTLAGELSILSKSVTDRLHLSSTGERTEPGNPRSICPYLSVYNDLRMSQKVVSGKKGMEKV